METAALCKPIQRFADLLRIPGTWVLTGLGKLLAALGSFPHFPQPLRLLHTHLYWRFLECQSIEVTLTQNGHLTHHEIPSVASLRPGGHFPRIGWPVSPEYALEAATTTIATLVLPCFEILFLVLFLAGLSTVVVALTTCSLTICLTTCMGVPQQRRIRRGGGPTTAENPAGGGPTTAWKNSPGSQ